MGLTKISGERMYGKSLLILIPFLFLNSCKYVPTAVNHRDIKLTDPGITMTVLDDDEINVLRGIAHLSFNADLNGNELYDVALYLDDRQVGHSYDPSSTINFDTRDYADGNYTLTFVLSAKSHTGSLADIIGSEAYVLTKQYQVQLFNAYVMPPGITDMFVENGALHVRWTKYEGPGFQRYVLSDGYHDAAVVTDPDSTECIDYAYTGGNITRKLFTYFAGTSEESASQAFSEYPRPQFTSVEVNSDNQVVLRWERNPFDSAFSYYKIYISGDSAATITDINTTSYTATDPTFGQENSYGFKAVPKAGEIFYPFPAEVTAQTGQAFDYGPSSFFDYIPALHTYFVYDNTRIYSYDESLSRTGYTWIQTTYNGGEFMQTGLSSNGQRFYIAIDMVAAMVIRVNPSTLETERTYHMSALAGRDIGRLYGISVSDNNLLLVLAEVIGDGPYNYIFDMNTDQLISYKRIGGSSSLLSYYVRISKDGKYIRSQDGLYMMQDTSMVFIGNVSPKAEFTEDPEYLADFSDNKVKILKCADLSVQKQMTFTQNLGDATLHVDKAGGYIGVESPVTYCYYIVDMQSLTIKRTIPIAGGYYCFTNMGIFGNYRAMFIHF